MHGAAYEALDIILNSKRRYRTENSIAIDNVSRTVACYKN